VAASKCSICRLVLIVSVNGAGVCTNSKGHAASCPLCWLLLAASITVYV
jgi:hypothetical protein